MKLEITEFETPEVLRAVSAFLLNLLELDVRAKINAEVDGRMMAIAPVEGKPQATVGINGASSELAPDSPASDPAGNEAGAEAAATAVDAPAATVTDDKPKRGRKAKATDVTDVEVKLDGAPVGAAVEGAKVTLLTLDDARSALQRYTEKNGMPAGIALLKNYGAGRISELDVEQYALFIAECDGE